jgi:hypothetical protein
VLYLCLQLYCDLHNDRAIGDQVGAYEIEHVRCGIGSWAASVRVWYVTSR